MMTGAGFEHYEVSNFARAGMMSRHNSAYWTGTPYVGIGPSAHSFDGATRHWNVSAYSEWIRRLSKGETVISGAESLTDENRTFEEVYLGYAPGVVWRSRRMRLAAFKPGNRQAGH